VIFDFGFSICESLNLTASDFSNKAVAIENQGSEIKNTPGPSKRGGRLLGTHWGILLAQARAEDHQFFKIKPIHPFMPPAPNDIGGNQASQNCLYALPTGVAAGAAGW